jgi:hypothetical protein
LNDEDARQSVDRPSPKLKIEELLMVRISRLAREQLGREE